MYDFIFAFLFQLNEKLRSSDSKYYSIVFLTMTIIFHFLFVTVLFEYLTGFNLLIEIYGAHTSNKYIFLLLAILIIFIINRIYSKRSDFIIEKYQSKNLTSIFNGVLILVIMFLPLIVGVLIVNILRHKS